MRTTRTERAHTPMAHSGTRARLPRLPATRNTEKSPSRPALAQPDASAHGGSNGADGGGCFCRDATEKRPAAHALARQNHAHIKSGSSITGAFAGRRAPRILTLTGSATLRFLSQALFSLNVSFASVSWMGLGVGHSAVTTTHGDNGPKRLAARTERYDTTGTANDATATHKTACGIALAQASAVGCR